MPVSAPHACAHPGCPALVPRGQARCEAHGRTADARRGGARARGYDAAWDRLSLAWRRDHALCARCEAHGRTTVATLVDHVVPLWRAPERRLDTSNLQSLCVDCHAAKTREDGSHG